MTDYTTMSTRQFNAILRHLGYTPYAASRLLGISMSSAYRIAGGEQAVPETVRRLLVMYERHGIPQELR